MRGAGRRLYSAEHVAEAILVFAACGHVFAYAAAGNIWHDPERLKIPCKCRGTCGALTRRMKREADLLQRRRVGQCP